METSLQYVVIGVNAYIHDLHICNILCDIVHTCSGIEIFCGSKNQAQPPGNQGDKVACQSMFVYEQWQIIAIVPWVPWNPLWAGASTDDRWTKWNPSPWLKN